MKDEWCAPGYVLGLLGRKWTYPILRHLRTAESFTHLEKSLPAITHHVLAEELKMLEQEGIIAHQGREYYLTESGAALLRSLRPLMDWPGTHKGLPPCPPHQRCADCPRGVTLRYRR